MKTRSQFTLLDVVGLAVFALFAAVVLYNSTSISMSYDDSFNASVAKNLALGLGYASSYDAITPFDKDVTTGPTLLLPVAVTIRLFGNTPWAPGVVTAIVTLAVLALVLWMARLRLRISFGLLALSCIPPLALLVQLTDGWNRLRGDILAGELIVLGTLLLRFERSTDSQSMELRSGVVAGMVLGLAVLTKFLALACVAAVVLVFIIRQLMQADRSLGEKSQLLTTLLLGALAPTALFELARLVALHGLDGYLASVKATLSAANRQDPAIGLILHGQYDFVARVKRVPEVIQSLWNYVGLERHPFAGSVFLLGWAAASAAGVVSSSVANRHRLIALALAGGGMMVLYIVILLVPFAGRAQLGAVVASLFVGLATAAWASSAHARAEIPLPPSKYRWWPALPLVMAAVWSVVWLVSFPKDARWEWRTERNSQVAVREAMMSIRALDSTATFCGLGWLTPRVLEYALPGAVWFRNCEPRAGEFSTGVAAAVYLVREPPQFQWLATPAEMEFARRCDRNIVHQDRYLVISRCQLDSAGVQL